MPNLATDVHALVTQLKAVVAKLNDSENLTVVVDRFAITLKLTMTDQTGVLGKNTLVLIGASQTDVLVQTLSLVFTERAPDATIQKFAAVALEEPLLRASEAIDIAVGEAAQGLEEFGFNAGSVTLAFTATEEGNLQFGLVKNIKHENVSTLELGFRLKRDTAR